MLLSAVYVSADVKFKLMVGVFAVLELILMVSSIP